MLGYDAFEEKLNEALALTGKHHESVDLPDMPSYDVIDDIMIKVLNFDIDICAISTHGIDSEFDINFKHNDVQFGIHGTHRYGHCHIARYPEEG